MAEDNAKTGESAAQAGHSDTALVLEGGGFRCMFTAGVLDVLMEHGIYDFGSVWGVSAGSMSASSFKSRQIGRTCRIMLAFRDDRRFISFWSLLTTGNIANGEFVYDEVQNVLDPCDVRTFNANPIRMFSVASNVIFGTADYLECKSFPEDVAKVQASASMPGVSQMVEVDGNRYLDGGTTDSIPFQTALGLEGGRQIDGYTPARRGLVVLTRDRDYVKELGNEGLVLRSHRYDAYPYFTHALETRYLRYNAQRDLLFAMEREEDPRVLVIAPKEPVTVDVTGSDGASLLALYVRGRQQAEERLDEIRAFLAKS
jgi:predicted patatin/cPLA2 family phospholipase